MINEIFKKEVSGHFTSNILIIAYAIVLTLFIANSMIFIKDYKNSMTQHENILTENLEQINKNSENLWQLTFVDQKLVCPPSVLGFIAEAREKKLPDTIKINFFDTSNPEYSKREDLFFSEFEALDWNNILILLVSFMCIFISYNAFSGEKAEGTLKLIISNSIPRSHVVLGKYMAICFVTFLPIILGVIVSLIILLVSSVILLSWNQILVIFFYLFASGMFISLNVCIGMLISALTPKPMVSLSFSILVWLFFSIVIPGIGWIIAKKTTPVKSLNNINTQLSTEIDALGGSRWDYRWKTPTAEVLKNKLQSDKQTEVTNKIWSEYRNDLFEQTKSGILLSKISPFQIFRFIGERIADNGFYKYYRFYDQIGDYCLAYRKFISDKDHADSESHHLIWARKYYTKGFMSNKPVSFEEVPKFKYKSPSLIQKIESIKWDLLILVLWNLFLFTGMFFAFIKYDVR